MRGYRRNGPLSDEQLLSIGASTHASLTFEERVRQQALRSDRAARKSAQSVDSTIPALLARLDRVRRELQAIDEAIRAHGRRGRAN
jgi:hypothetical protein